MVDEMSIVLVKSSNISHVGYDADTRDLTVKFKTGATHRYADVPPEKHAALMAADSIGSHFHQNIRNAHKSRKVDD